MNIPISSVNAQLISLIFKNHYLNGNFHVRIFQVGGDY